ncbi:MAG: DUF885 domain-containing protein [Cellulomonadaceae bacterium]|jgi:uncharacterized protein (DUF885 family)|nr:DUF885 domain-containing protein [Cellulomonadaceae bacterium]
MTTTTSPRTPTAIDGIAEDYAKAYAALDPLAATSIGIPGFDDQMTDHSPAGIAERAELARSTVRALQTAEPVDEVDRVTVAAMSERLGLDGEFFDSGEVFADLNNIASPVQGLRDIFDLVPTATTEDWQNIAARLSKIPRAMDGYIESLRLAASQGKVAAIRQVEEALRQSALQAGDESFFPGFVDGAGDLASDGLKAELADGVAAAQSAYGKLTAFLASELAPQAPSQDGVGRERYRLFSRMFLGAEVDLDETYAWGVEELRRITDEQTRIAAQIAGPGASVEKAVAALDADPTYVLNGTDALKTWMQTTSDQAIEDLGGTHFDIDGPMRTLECLIAPTHTGVIYYTAPSDDFSRPGRMWWSVPEGQDTFGTWREKTTVYHEGVPGHHLQIAAAVAKKDTLNSWRRLMCWVSGHGEGWALYAEELMAELGYLDDPADRLGMLDGQRLRAARVVFDIGMHLGLKAPAEYGGQVWTPEAGLDFLRSNVNMTDDFVKFEWMRYLGWPGQAPSYKIGQRIWQQVRKEAEAAAGADFNARDFHTRALNLGALPLSVLSDAVLGKL